MVRTSAPRLRAEHDQQRDREGNDDRRPDDIGGNERREMKYRGSSFFLNRHHRGPMVRDASLRDAPQHEDQRLLI